MANTRFPSADSDGYTPPDLGSSDPAEDPAVVAASRADARLFRNIDGFKNELTGIGDPSRDKTLGGGYGNVRFITQLLSRPEVESRWRGSDLGGRIVEQVPAEMMREGWEISIQPEDDEEGARDEVQDVVEALETQLRDMGVLNELSDALKYERAYGGGAVLLGIDDGQNDLTKPLDEKRIKALRHLTAFSGGWDGEIIAWRYYNDPRKPNFGMPEVYMLRNLGVPVSAPPAPGEPMQGYQAMPAGPTGALVFYVHESRLLIFSGTAVSRRTRVQMRGWGDSIFTRVEEVLSQFGQTWGGIANLMTDWAQGVLKVEGIRELLTTQVPVAGATGEGAVARRMMAINLSKSIARTMLLDKEEEFTRETTPLSGVAEVLQQFALRLAAAADMPVSLLMGQAPAGLNATGASDIRFFYDRIAAKQRSGLLPQLHRLVRLMLLAKEGPTKGVEPERWSIEMRPLYQMSALEEADLRLKQAQVDQVYLSTSVVTADEVAASRFGGSRYSTDTVIDLEGRKAMAKAGLAPNGAPLTPPPGAPGAPQPAEKKGDEEPSPEQFAAGMADDKHEKKPTIAEFAACMDFNPDQLRDKDGKFSGEGGGGAPNASVKEKALDHIVTTNNILKIACKPINQGPGPVLSREEAEKFAADSPFKQAFYRGTSRPQEGVFIPIVSDNMSLSGRGVYMLQKENIDYAKKYGTIQELRIAPRNPIDRYGEEGKKLVASEEYKAVHAKIESLGGFSWQTNDAAAFQAVAQAHGYDAMYYHTDEGPIGGVCVWDASKVAVVKDGTRADFDPDEQRANNGEWTSGAGGLAGDLARAGVTQEQVAQLAQHAHAAAPSPRATATEPHAAPPTQAPKPRATRARAKKAPAAEPTPDDAPAGASDVDKLFGVTAADHARADAAWSKIAKYPEGSPWHSQRAKALEKHFAKLGLGDTYTEMRDGWLKSSSAEAPMKAAGVLASMGVRGTVPSNDVHAGDFERAAAQPPAAYKQYAREMYLLSQASLRANGVKEVELYRGIAKQGDALKPGARVRLGTRQLSSWTDSRQQAERFRNMSEDSKVGGTVVKMKVPATAVFMSHHLLGNYQDESEYVVMGAQRYASEVLAR